jgi:hypothetical protein
VQNLDLSFKFGGFVPAVQGFVSLGHSIAASAWRLGVSEGIIVKETMISF